MTEGRKIIQVGFPANCNMANKMLQYMAARKLAAALGDFEIANVSIPEWSLSLPSVAQPHARKLNLISSRTVALDFASIINEVQTKNLNRIWLNIYSSHLSNLMDRGAYKHDFPPQQQNGYGSDVLVINIRAAEILSGDYPNYVVLPIAFYADVIRDTGLRPIFLGQVTGKSRYLDGLHAAFPDAEFVPSAGAMHDFDVLRKSSNVVLSISTFSWLATWLGDAERIIMPMAGFLNQEQCPWVDLLPKNDKRYEIYKFGKYTAVPDRLVLEQHKQVRWQKVA